MLKKNHKKKICLHGENHFSKTRSESKGYNPQSESYNQYKGIKTKNDIRSENEDIEVKKEEKLETLLRTAKAKVTAKADEVKAIEKTLEEFRVEKDKQVDKTMETEASVTLPPHFATTINISILTFTIFIFTFNIFISIFNPFVSDHHFQTSTIGDLSDCKAPCLSQQTNPAQTKTTVNALANTNSI
jgi:Fe2+ transport system protein B